MCFSIKQQQSVCLIHYFCFQVKVERIYYLYIYESENFSVRPFFFLLITDDRAEQNKMDFMGFSSRKDPKVQ
jgi:hypothetical protein